MMEIPEPAKEATVVLVDERVDPAILVTVVVAVQAIAVLLVTAAVVQHVVLANYL